MRPWDLLFPPGCVFCGRITNSATPCAECLKEAKELTATVCRRCGAYPEDCSCHGKTFSFKRNVSCFTYENGPRSLLLRYKMQNKPQLADFMARRMYYHICARLGTDFDAVTYVPQSYGAQVRRGFSPSGELAARIAGQLKLPLCKTLIRTGATVQKALSAAERWQNARRNYQLLPRVRLSGRVLLIDDHFTTGATLNACAELLRQAGAEEVVTATFTIDVKKS